MGLNQWGQTRLILVIIVNTTDQWSLTPLIYSEFSLKGASKALTEAEKNCRVSLAKEDLLK